MIRSISRLQRNILLCVWILFSSWGCAHPGERKGGAAFLDGIKIHYLKEGCGEKTLVFIHGWACDSTFWRYQTAYFQKEHTVIAIDLPGHGTSAKPDIPYTFDLFAESIKEVMNDAGVEKAFLVGHSMGYPVARRFIQKYPERSSGLCIVDGAYFRVPIDAGEFIEWTMQNEEFVRAFKSGDREAFIDHFLESLFVEETLQALKTEIKQAIIKTPPHVGNSAMEEMVKPENWKEFPLTISTLAVYAVSPDVPEDNEAYLRTLFPNVAYHAWDRVGHFIMMEQPERFNLLLERYVRIQPIEP